MALKYLDAGKPQGVLGKSRIADAVEGRRWKLGSAPEQAEHGARSDGWPFRVSEISANTMQPRPIVVAVKRDTDRERRWPIEVSVRF